MLTILISGCTPKSSDEGILADSTVFDMIVDSLALEADTTFFPDGSKAPKGTPEFTFDKFFWAMYEDDFELARKYVTRRSYSIHDELIASKIEKIRSGVKRDKSPTYEILDKTPMVNFSIIKVLIHPAGHDMVKRYAVVREKKKWRIDYALTKRADVWGKVEALKRALELNKDNLEDFSNIYSYPIDDLEDLSERNIGKVVHEEAMKNQEAETNTKIDSLRKAKIDSLRKVKVDSILRAKADSIDALSTR
jgi:Uri superfamily endonuclease